MSLSNRERAAQLDEILGRGPPSPTTPASPSPRLNRTGLQRPTIISASSSRSGNTAIPAPHVSSPALQTSFPRPSYLDNSALRHLLHSELPPTLPPNRYRFDGSTSESLSNPSIGSQRKRGPLNIDSDDDDTDVSVDGRESPSVPRLPNAPTYLRLPTRWSENDRNTALTIGPGGRELFFQGLEGKESAAAARTNVSIPPACGIYYYEVLILDKGTKGYISIGFSARDVRLTRLPGWESQSWGYHGDDGQVFTGGSELPFGKKFTTGDVIGCGIDFTTHRAFYTKGGVFINSVFNDVGAKAEIFPSVGLRSQGESIRANFGQEPFKFDINAYVQQERTRVWRAIQSTPIDVVDDHFQLPPGAKLPSLEPGSMRENKANEPPRKTLKRMNELIYAYLVHHGYSGTARAFRSHPEKEEEEDKEDLAVASRQNIVRAVLSGDIDTAISETSSKYPEVLEVQDGIMLFKLKCRKFVEMILDVAEAYRKEVEASGKQGAGAGAGGGGESEAEVESVVLPSMPPPLAPSSSGAPGSAFPTLGPPISPMASTSNGTGGPQSHTETPSYQSLFLLARSYGQLLSTTYKDDRRSSIQTSIKRASSLIAFVDPLRAEREEVGSLAGQGARNELAGELNRAILESMGLPTTPALEKMYCQSVAAVTVLGCYGVGAAAFADTRREFLED
ncbi:SPRY-domain-containing protein [Sistotremastrum niveocremeum HHB9708]|uniref:SPRY-domain-containing protein n=1 Tax=Sistotremastrum niveocremeum HHB9708 TaxID=1314777 RepID=A0A164R5L7_9AGAM|nr:SPRY-domain-containing protein [Sistotremastrum niveocremeum HHB9708]